MSLDKIKIQKSAKKFIHHFDSGAEIEIIENNGGYNINIKTEISGILIGRRGETLEALQHLMRLVLASEFEEFVPLQVDVSGYKALHQKELEENALMIAKTVLETGNPQALPPMNAYERRQIHLILKDIEGIETESVGSPPLRQIEIRKKK